MAILGTNPYTRAIPVPGGGYSVSSAGSGTIKHYTVNVPKTSPYYKAPAKPKAAPVKTAVAAPAPAKVSANYQTVQAPQVASAPVAAAAPAPTTLDDLINKYYAASQGDINGLYDNQMSQRLADLKASQDKATASTKQDYYNQKNQADVVNAQNVQKLRELMASQGIAASGDNLTLNAKANSDRMNSLNALSQQEQAKLNDINDPQKAQSLKDQINTARMQALLNAKQAAYQRAWNEYGFNNMSAAQQAQLAMSKYNLDSTNAANSASSQAALDYYNSMGFNGGSGGGGTAAKGTAAFNQNMAAAVKRGVDASWVPLLTEIVRRESGFNPSAKNPSSTAYGYAQFLNSTRSAYEKKMGLSYNDPVNQLIMMAQYVKDRYGNPQNALNFWNRNNWY